MRDFKNAIFVVGWLLLSVALSSCFTKELRVENFTLPTHASNGAGPRGEYYVIGPGDVLEVVVWKTPSVSGTVKVRPDGFITVPLINEVKVSGLSTAQLRGILEKKYKDFITDPFVTIRVQDITSNEIYVVGEVNNPGAYPLRGNDTVLQLLTRAGGLSAFADRDKVQVVRQVSEKVTRYTVDYDAILKGELEQDILVKSGDRIIVP